MSDNHYGRYRRALTKLLRSEEPKAKRAVAKANAALGKLKLLTPGAVHTDSVLENISVQYKNEDYIGLGLMPVAPVKKLSDLYLKYDKRDRLEGPDDTVGARGDANEIEESARTPDSYIIQPRALKNYIDVLTLQNQDAPLDEMVDLVESLNEIMDLKEEIRIANLLTTSGNFAGNTTALGAGVRWDTSGGGNPIKDLQEAIAAIWMGRGPSSLTGYCSLDVWNVLSRHPAILDLFKFNGSSPGLATPDMLARFVGLDKILVGKARKDTTNKGQAAVYARVWGNVFGIVRVAKSPGLRTAAFGYTLRMGAKATTQWFDPSKGTDGGYYARVAVKETHKVVAPDTGFLITTPIG